MLSSRGRPRGRRPVIVAAAALLQLPLGAVALHPAAAAAPGGTGQVTGYQGLCLDDRSASTANFNPVQVYTCNGTAAQQWTPGFGRDAGGCWASAWT
ncbi:hypothetical protein [Streptacidiphilus melanogenes]|uniref:hypothetical protein n=1 Tax=Streptacidiphilus melanogenes TaxID=411235 RepID=UPI001F3F5971|nr:hypothetical protein [Streptacidiphilus melanogenes]